MKNKNFDYPESAKAAVDVAAKWVLFPVVGIVSLFAVYGIATGAPAAGSLAHMETAYKMTIDDVEARKKALNDGVALLCEQETAIASRKLEDHYAKRSVLLAPDLERLTFKAKGERLDCMGF